MNRQPLPKGKLTLKYRNAYGRPGTQGVLCPQVSYGAITTLPVVKQVRVGAAAAPAARRRLGSGFVLQAATESLKQVEEGKEIVCFSR